MSQFIQRHTRSLRNNPFNRGDLADGLLREDVHDEKEPQFAFSTQRGMKPASSVENAFEGSEKSFNRMSRAGERIVPQSRGQSSKLVPNVAQPTPDSPVMLGVLFFQGCQASDDCAGITGLHDVFHLLFEPRVGLLRQAAAILLELARDALLMVKDTHRRCCALGSIQAIAVSSSAKPSVITARGSFPRR